MSQMILGYKYF